VYVLDPRAGLLKREIALPPGQIEGLPTVPTGLAFTAEGNLAVSDGQNHRLLVLTPDGAIAQTITRQTGSWSLITPNSVGGPGSAVSVPMSTVAATGRPGSVGVGADGALLALDILGPGIINVRRDGTLGATFARPSDSKSGVFDATDIAVDASGRIFVADDLLHGIQVYDRNGESLGVIGRSDPNSFTAPTDVQRPSALAVQGDRLYVIDRGRGLLVYQIPATTTAPSAPLARQ
jgi:hypothetical protein